MYVRAYTDADLSAVAAVFTASVHGLAAPDYSDEQRMAWAPQPPDLGSWRERLGRRHTIVAVEGADVAGFISHEPTGHIEHLYVAPQYARRGMASLLYRRVEATLSSAGVRDLCTEASIVARPFFERFGFLVKAVQEVSLRGSSLRRYAMHKRLAAAQAGDAAAGARLR